jgi:hypothetical protein
MIAIDVAAGFGDTLDVKIEWGGEAIERQWLTEIPAGAEVKSFGPASFVHRTHGEMQWWSPVETKAEGGNVADAERQFADVDAGKCRMVNMDGELNANVTDIFRNRYLSPRSPYTTLQIPVQGIGEWCHPLQTADIDDSGLRSAAVGGVLKTSLGVDFRSPTEGHNVAFTSLWDNYPDSLTVELNGRASHAYLLMAGSTNHMQSRIENGVVKVYYKDGSCSVLPLVNPDNWAPIEQLYFEDGAAFSRQQPSLFRLRLKQGDVSDSFGNDSSYTGVNRMVDGGAALLLDMPLDRKKRLSRMVVETLSPDVVVGLMSVTLQK